MPRVARSIRVRGTVQGVGFRPFVFRLARAHGLAGWVLNGDAGVEIHVEGAGERVTAFLADLTANAPPAARIASLQTEPADSAAFIDFEIRRSESDQRPTTRVTPDLPVCDRCLAELFDASNRRYRYPYINCTNCGPRYSIVRALPYDRPHTTMAAWPLCASCAAEYNDPGDRRFHAQPVACAACGPGYRLVHGGSINPFDFAQGKQDPPYVGDDAGGSCVIGRSARASALATGQDAIVAAASLLRDGRILAVKGIGGYHLACNADDENAVAELRNRKYRKEQAFAIMARDMAVAERTCSLTPDALALLTSSARPIVLAPAREALPGVAPDNRDVGVMLPYAPLHHLLFAAGAPERLVMTSGNRSSEPIAFADEDALTRLHGLADAFLAGERPIARRVDDSVVRAGALGPMILRRSRGLAPDAVATFPTSAPMLAVGGDLKNTVTLVVAGQAYVSQHIGDLSHLDSRRAFEETIRDLLAMYAIDISTLTVAHDAHPEYASTVHALELPCAHRLAIQHHRAHIASVLAERDAFEHRVVGIAFDGTGYGDDGSIWGGEIFAGSVAGGFERVGHLRPAALAGGDAAARFPVQASAGFLTQLDESAAFTSPPFNFPERFDQARAILRSGVRVFPTTSAGRLFDTVAALLGFVRPITFEGQAAMWLEHLARGDIHDRREFPCRFDGREIDWRETLAAVVSARSRGMAPDAIARGFHRSMARAIAGAAIRLAHEAGTRTVVLSGGVMQNDLLLADIRDALAGTGFEPWTNRAVPPNDGGVSLGQAAVAVYAVPR